MFVLLADDPRATPDPAVAVTLVLSAARRGRAVGIGAAPSEDDAADLAGAALVRAGTHPDRVVVRGADPRAADEAGAVLAVLADLARRRTAPGWAVVDLLTGGTTQARAARTLGVTRQAVSQRALAAGWRHERDLSPLAARLLTAAARPTSAPDDHEDAGGSARDV